VEDRCVESRSGQIRQKVMFVGAVVAGAVSIAVATAAPSRTVVSPPGGLSAYGQLAWNFEGLLWRTLGTAEACQQTSPTYTFNWTRAACGLPLSNRIEWQPIFTRHTASAFRLSASAPPDLGNVAAIRIAGRWVRCAGNTWLIITGAGSMLCNPP
jgi:hypothetical protein